MSAVKGCYHLLGRIPNVLPTVFCTQLPGAPPKLGPRFTPSASLSLHAVCSFSAIFVKKKEEETGTGVGNKEVTGGDAKKREEGEWEEEGVEYNEEGKEAAGRREERKYEGTRGRKGRVAYLMNRRPIEIAPGTGLLGALRDEKQEKWPNRGKEAEQVFSTDREKNRAITH